MTSGNDQYTGAHKRAIEEDPNAHQLTFDYVPPIWLGLYGHLCPIFNIQFPIGLSTNVRMTLWVSKGIAEFRHCVDPAVTVGDGFDL